jgi:hypothetical protein
MDERTSAQEGEASGAAGGVKPKREGEGEDQAGLEAGPPNSQVQNQEEGSTDSSEYDTTLHRLHQNVLNL